MPSVDLGRQWSLVPKGLYSHSALHLHTPSSHTLTMRCWKSQERMILVACLGKTPRLFLDFLSSLSRREVRSRLTFRVHGEKVSISSQVGQQLGTCCHSDGRLSLPTPFPTHSRVLGGHLSHYPTPAPQRIEKGRGEEGGMGVGEGEGSEREDRGNSHAKGVRETNLP